MSQSTSTMHDKEQDGVLGNVLKVFVSKDGDRLKRHAIAILLVINFSLLAVVLVLASALSVAFPLVREVPYFVHYASDEKTIIRTERLNVESDRLELIAKRLAADYARVRLEIVPDAAEMDRRWNTECLQDANLDSIYCGYVFNHSTTRVYNQFLQSIQADSETINRFIAAGKIREVRFGNNEPRRRNKWEGQANGAPVFEFEIDLLLVDKQFDPEEQAYRDINKQAFTATIRCAIVGATTQSDKERFANPFAFRTADWRMDRRST